MPVLGQFLDFTVRLRKTQTRQRTTTASQYLHLPDGGLIETLQTLPLGQFHMDELGVQAFKIGQHQQLLNGSVVAHVAFQRQIRVPPLFGSPTEKSDVEEIGLACIDSGRLHGGDDGWDEV